MEEYDLIEKSVIILMISLSSFINIATSVLLDYLMG